MNKKTFTNTFRFTSRPGSFLRKISLICLSICCFTANADSIFEKNGKHSVYVGFGQAALYHDFETYGESEIIPTFSYSYGREYTFFPLIDFHVFKNSSGQTYFSSKALTMSFGHNLFSLDLFYFSYFAGLGFYQPKALRLINNVLAESSSKLVFGTNLGVEAFLKLNGRNGFAMRFHYHNPFDLTQDIGGDLKGHYTILSANFVYNF